MIKNNLLKIRLSLGYKYAKDFANYLEINSNQYTKYESNKMQPASEVLLKICKKLNKPINEIIYEEE
jgi:putative transcriptional regulator